jgi:electron transport complex protein RnfA
VNFADIIFTSLLANNLLVFSHLGLSEYLIDPRPSLKRLWTMAAFLVVGAGLFWLPDHYFLQPLHLEFLRTLLVFALVGLVFLVYSALGPETLPKPEEFLIHSVLVGGIVLTGSSSADLLEVLAGAASVAVGYGLAVVLLAAVHRRLARERVPDVVRGLPLQLVTLGVVWLALHGLSFAFSGKAP